MKDMLYKGSVTGRKRHLIFKRGDSFLVLTEMTREGRGNYYQINKDELERITSQLKSKSVPQVFHPDKVIDDMSSFHGHKRVHKKELEKDASYLKRRLGVICYVLVYLKLLTIEKKSRMIYFKKTKKLSSQKGK